jgi:uncharacterized membrane protein
MKCKKKDALVKEIEKELKKEEHDITKIENIVEKLKECVVDRTPSYFSNQDVVISFLGALFFGITFIMKGNLINTTIRLDSMRLVLISIATILVLVLGIYFLGYKRVKDRERRRPFQFIMKRLITLYIVSIIVPFFLIYIFAVNQQVGTMDNVIKLVVVLSMPCAIGTSISYLFNKF